MNEAPQTPKEYRDWETPSNWIDTTEAARFMPESILKKLPAGCKVCILDCGEISDCFLAKTPDGKILMWYSSSMEERHSWRQFVNEDRAFQTHLNHNPWL